MKTNKTDVSDSKLRGWLLVLRQLHHSAIAHVCSKGMWLQESIPREAWRVRLYCLWTEKQTETAAHNLGLCSQECLSEIVLLYMYETYWSGWRCVAVFGLLSCTSETCFCTLCVIQRWSHLNSKSKLNLFKEIFKLFLIKYNDQNSCSSLNYTL